ncbi:hypothetical protein [Salipiger mucosus]|uniref:Uncharacterized protein n=1 Tax=Salipiger mucosus DSM 16094 TaxID=1123237 RepID=S9S7A6_9RHOB|nr:hypothetical protein [Salipiger mucosus]EPX82079.1 hypothetical protein Salmuc_02446 [Salipiger mucosus DSM 16094]
MAYLYEAVGALALIVTTGIAVVEFFTKRADRRLDVSFTGRSFINASGNTAVYFSVENRSEVELRIIDIRPADRGINLKFGDYASNRTIEEFFEYVQRIRIGTNGGNDFETINLLRGGQISGFVSLGGEHPGAALVFQLQRCDTLRTFRRHVQPLFWDGTLANVRVTKRPPDS